MTKKRSIGLDNCGHIEGSTMGVRGVEQHLDSLRRKDSLKRAETTKISVRLENSIPPRTLRVLL